MEEKTTVLVDNLRFPESPKWHDGKLWLVDFFTRQVLQTDLKGKVQTILDLPDLPSGIDWTPGGHLLIVSGRQRRVFQQEDGRLDQVMDLSNLVTYPCSHLVVDQQGRVYIGNLGFDFVNPQAAFQPGSILLVTPEWKAHVVAEGLAFPNAMVITPDAQTLMVAESYAARISAFDIQADGSLSPARVWAQFDRSVTPDGICLDAEGAIWVASPGTRETFRVNANADVSDRISMETIPLACMLGGPERRTLFLLSTESLNPQDRQARGRIEAIEVDVPGAGLP